MHLTDEDKRMLNGEYGDMVRRSMKILVTLGEIYGAERMLDIRNVHSPGVSYRVAGDAGLNFVKEASQSAHCKVLTTLNTMGIDSERWEEFGFPREFALKQLELSDAYRAVGAIPTYTCTPFLVGNVPLLGEHIAWGESSAIAFVNSVIGARTNREGGPSALAAALTGRVPEYGYHLDENRRGKFLFRVDTDLETDRDFAVLGYFAGKIAGREVPVFEGLKRRPTLENLKALSAAVASSGAVALYHIVGVTPEAPVREAVIDNNTEPILFGRREYEETVAKFMLSGDIDCVVVGCPHCSIAELREIAQLLSGKKVKVDTFICTSKHAKDISDRTGYTGIIEATGARIVIDTCPVLGPTLPKGYRTMATSSGKLAHYAPGLWKLRTALLHLEDCVGAALKGRWGEQV